MSFKQFNPCNPCCDVECKVGIYPANGPTGSGKTESNFYYALNVPTGEEVYDPNMDETFTSGLNPYDIDILIYSSHQTCSYKTPRFGYGEFITYLERGKTILICAEWASCLGIYINTIHAFLSALGSTMTISPTLVHEGCQRIINYAPLNTLNWNVPQFPVGGGSTVNVGSGWPIAMNNFLPTPSCIAAAEDRHGGKVLLFGDDNSLTCGGTIYLNALYANCCATEGQLIEEYDGP